MKLLEITWPMIAAICGMLGVIQGFLWFHGKRSLQYPLTMIMSFGAATLAMLEMGLSSSPDAVTHEKLLLWANLAIAAVIISLVWAIRYYLPTARQSLATLITVLWIIGTAINFLLPGNLTFSEILGVESHLTVWGEEYFVATGVINDWKWLTDVTVLLIPVYVIDAAWRARRHPRAWDGWIVAGGAMLFVLVAGVHAGLVDLGLSRTPYMISIPFSFVVLAMSWILASSVIRAGKLDTKVAEARRETERLMRANLLGEVAATMAHELNQPLAAILGNAQAAEKFLEHPDPDLDEIREILADIVRDDKRARDIITTLRRMLRGDYPQDQRVGLEAITRELLDFMGEEFNRHSISVQLTSERDIPDVCGGHVAIQQVIMNLVLNAARAIREAGIARREIHIQLLEHQRGAEIVVRDFGPGIAQEVGQSIFEPFVTTKKGSLGMGLAVCRRIVENQGGRMTAENAEGGGARFRVWLPACKL